VAWDFSEDIPVLEARIPIVCEILEREELESFASVDVFQRPLAILESRLNEGQICFVAKHRGLIVSGGWVEFGTARSTGPVGRAFPLAADEVYFHSGFTVPEYRGNGIRPAAQNFQFRWLAQANYRRAVGFIALSNRANLRAYPKSGGRRAGTVGYFEMLGWRWYFCSAKGVLDELDKPNYLCRVR